MEGACTMDKKELDRMAEADKNSIIKILYDYYIENDAIDTADIRRRCEELDHLMRELTWLEHERIWDISMKLCGLHEQRGFSAGVRMGAALRRELEETGQGRGS